MVRERDKVTDLIWFIGSLSTSFARNLRHNTFVPQVHALLVNEKKPGRMTKRNFFLTVAFHENPSSAINIRMRKIDLLSKESRGNISIQFCLVIIKVLKCWKSGLLSAAPLVCCGVYQSKHSRKIPTPQPDRATKMEGDKSTMPRHRGSLGECGSILTDHPVQTRGESAQKTVQFSIGECKTMTRHLFALMPEMDTCF